MITLSNTQRNLNDGTTYYLISCDLGAPDVTEVWIEPNASGAPPTLASHIDRKTKMIITIAIKASTVAALVSAVNNVVSDFQSANVVTWGLNGASTRAINTYQTSIELPPMSNRDELFVANNQFIIPIWQFGVWRAPLDTGGNYFAI